MSAMIFSLAALFVFFQLVRTYYSRVWEVNQVEAMASAQNLALFLVSEAGNWTDDVFNSGSIAFGGAELNQTRLERFFGMAYQTAQNKLLLPQDFRAEAWRLPSLGISSDIAEIYVNTTVDINFETTENANLSIVLLGTQGSTGYSFWNQSTGKYHGFSLSLPTGIYGLKALAVSGEKYGAYETVFRVI